MNVPSVTDNLYSPGLGCVKGLRVSNPLKSNGSQWDFKRHFMYFIKLVFNAMSMGTHSISKYEV